MLKSVKEADVKGRKVLCRVDYNVPVSDGEISDDTRIRKSIPTIRYLLENDAKIVLMAHFGRPGGEPIGNLSLAPIAERLENILGMKVKFASDTVGENARQALDQLGHEYNVVLLENTRFNPGEKKNDRNFSKKLAEFGDVFVSDAFGAVHRAHASTRGVTRYLPGYAGLLILEEYNTITNAMNNPKSPSIALFGGAKISTKLDVLQNFIGRVNIIALGGGMANTFLAAQGHNVGNSLYEEDMIDTAKHIMRQVEENDMEIIIPRDVRIAKSFDEPYLEAGVAKVVNASEVPDGTTILDIGPKTTAEIVDRLIEAETVIWNGPLGVFEKEYYDEGTMMIAKEILKLNKQTVVGGGETAYAVNIAAGDKEIHERIHLSTGGGASLELMAGKDLPGLTCLTGEPLDD